MSLHARILDVVRDAAARGDDLAVALRASGLPGTAVAADRLAAGATVPEALAGLLPPRLAALLAGGLPPLATVAALLADEAWRRDERRRLVVVHLAYPVVSCLVVAGLALLLARCSPPGPLYGPIMGMRLALPPAALAVLLLVAPWLPRSWRLPGSGWARHLDLAVRWARAGLAVRWRLTEAQALAILGADLTPFSPVLGQPGAADHCARLAAWHLAAARWRLTWMAVILSGLILAVGGGIVLGSLRIWLAHPV